MPNAGIHGTRSTIWKSADVPSKAAQTATVSANTTSEMPRAIVAHEAVPLAVLVGQREQEERADERRKHGEGKEREGHRARK